MIVQLNPYFPPFEGRFLGPPPLTFLPGKRAGSKLFGWILHIFFGKAPRFCRRFRIQDRSHLRPLNARWVKMLRPFWLLLSNAFWKNNIFGSLCPIFKSGVSKCTKLGLLSPMVMSISLSEPNSSPKKCTSGPLIGSSRVPYEGHFAWNGSIYKCGLWKCTKSR